MPSLDVFGETYVLWYDQIPDYAIYSTGKDPTR